MDQRIAANSKSLFFARLRSKGNAEIAHYLNCAESTVSELSGKEKYKFNFDSLADLLGRLDLKIVPAENKCLNPEKLEIILKLAQMGMDKMSTSDLWEDA